MVSAREYIRTYGDVIKEAARSPRRDVKGQPVMIEPQAAITCTGDSLSPNTIYRMYRKTVTTVLRFLSVCSNKNKRNSQILVMLQKYKYFMLIIHSWSLLLLPW